MTERPSLEKRLAAYAALATAAGVSMLAIAEPAQSEVVFTKSETHLSCPVTFSIDMNNDGITDFKFVTDATYHGTGINVSGPPSNAVIAYTPSLAKALQPHAPIVPTRNFQPASGPFSRGVILGAYDISGSEGAFPHTRYRALGVRFQINGQRHYGWIGFSRFAGPCDATLAGWAYETLPNRPLRAGQTGGKSDDVTSSPQSFEEGAPIPAIPAVLSLGAEGLKLWRKGSE